MGRKLGRTVGRALYATRAFHKSQDRPTVAMLTASASAPSSASSAAIGPPSIVRLRLSPRVDLGIDRPEHRRPAKGPDGDHAMRAQQRDRLVRERFSECGALVRRRDDDIGGAELLTNIEDRYAGGKESGVMIHRAACGVWTRLNGITDRRVAVGDRHHVRALLVDFAMEKALQESGAAPLPRRRRNRDRIP